MALDAEPVDVARFPGLEELADEVQRTHVPRVLQRHGEDIAVLVPVETSAGPDMSWRRPKTREDYEAFLSSFGGWADVDTDAFLKANRESRDRSSRPPVEL